MLNKEKREEYDRMAANVVLGSACYQPARKSRFSKSAKNKHGPAPQFL